MTRTLRVLRTGAGHPAFNMGLDEALLDQGLHRRGVIGGLGGAGGEQKARGQIAFHRVSWSFRR